jgi:hypothetical protein
MDAVVGTRLPRSVLVLVGLLLVQGACCSRPDTARPSPAEVHCQRLQSLFECLARTHGGPSFISQAELAGLREEALRRLDRAFEAEGAGQKSSPAKAGGDGGGRMDTALTSTCEWSMRQLSDPHAKYIQPAQAEEMSDRYHGRVELGVRTCDEPCRATTTGSGWQSLRLPPRPRTMRTLVTAVAERSPAERAGLRVGDEILEVAGTALRDGEAREHAAVGTLLQADEGARVPILVRREGCDRPIRLSVRVLALAWFPPPFHSTHATPPQPTAQSNLSLSLPFSPDRSVVHFCPLGQSPQSPPTPFYPLMAHPHLHSLTSPPPPPCTGPMYTSAPSHRLHPLGPPPLLALGNRLAPRSFHRQTCRPRRRSPTNRPFRGGNGQRGGGRIT